MDGSINYSSEVVEESKSLVRGTKNQLESVSDSYGSLDTVLSSGLFSGGYEKIKSQGSLDEEIVELIKHAKTAFPRNTTIIKSEEAKLLNLPIIKLYYKNHTLFRILNKIAYLILKYFKI